MAEWLRRVIRNHLGSPRAGSNPVQCVLFYFLVFSLLISEYQRAIGTNITIVKIAETNKSAIKITAKEKTTNNNKNLFTNI